MKKIKTDDIMGVGLILIAFFLLVLSVSIKINLVTRILGFSGSLILLFAESIYLFQKYLR